MVITPKHVGGLLMSILIPLLKYFFCTSVGSKVTYLLTPWCRVLLEKLTGLRLVKKFPAFYGTWRFITALTSVRHLSLSWASPIQSIYQHPTSWRSIIILSTHLRLGLPSGLFPSGFPTKTLYTPFSSLIRATCPVHLILLDFGNKTLIISRCTLQLWNKNLMQEFVRWACVVVLKLWCHLFTHYSYLYSLLCTAVCIFM